MISNTDIHVRHLAWSCCLTSRNTIRVSETNVLSPQGSNWAGLTSPFQKGLKIVRWRVQGRSVPKRKGKEKVILGNLKEKKELSRTPCPASPHKISLTGDSLSRVRVETGMVRREEVQGFMNFATPRGINFAQQILWPC